MKDNTSAGGLQPSLTEARKLHKAGFKLCQLHPLSKRPVGSAWNLSPISDIDPKASGYGLLLAANGLASIDPDHEKHARKALGAAGFNLDALMGVGVRTLSTRPGSGGRSTFKAAEGCRWYKFRIKRDGHTVTVFELRADSPNLQDVIPGLVYKDREGTLCQQRYANGKSLAKAPKIEIPKVFAAWWRRMSSDANFRRQQETLMAEACGADAVPDLSRTGAKGEALPFAAPHTRTEFNEAHDVAQMLAQFGYAQHGTRWAAPDAEGAPGIREIPGKRGLWQSDHGSDPLHGTFDAWTVNVIYEHNYDVEAAVKSWKARGAKPTEVKKAINGLPRTFKIDDLTRMGIKPTEYAVDGLIAPGLTLLAAPPKIGKSYLVLQMCLCVAAGLPFLGRETRKMPVVYFDLEEWHNLLLERYTPMKEGNNIPDGVDLTIALDIPVGAGAVERLQQAIDAGAKLIVVDIFASIRDEMNEDVKKPIYVRDRAVMNDLAEFALRQSGVSIVIVHHTNKVAHEHWMDKVGGSAGLTGSAHTVMGMQRPDTRGWDEEAKKEGLNYRVLHVGGKQVKDQELALEKMPDGAGWQLSAFEPWEVNLTIKQKKIVRLLMARYPEFVPGKEIAELLGMKYANAKQIMHKLAESKLIESEGRGGGGYRCKPDGS